MQLQQMHSNTMQLKTDFASPIFRISTSTGAGEWKMDLIVYFLSGGGKKKGAMQCNEMTSCCVGGFGILRFHLQVERTCFQIQCISSLQHNRVSLLGE